MPRRAPAAMPPDRPDRPARPLLPSGAATAARQRIDDEHRQLSELLRSLSHSRDLERLGKLLGELRQLLESHFAGEEGGEGLHRIIEEGASHRLPNLERLYAEHRSLMAEVDQLRAAASSALTGPVRNVLDGVAALAAALRRHEQEENALFGEAFYLDLGGRS